MAPVNLRLVQKGTPKGVTVFIVSTLVPAWIITASVNYQCLQIFVSCSEVLAKFITYDEADIYQENDDYEPEIDAKLQNETYGWWLR